MEKNIRKRVCRSAAVLSAVLVVISGYGLLSWVPFSAAAESDSVSLLVEVWLEDCCISDKHITFHSGRHTCATLLLTQGTDLYTIMRYLGHQNINTTQRYAHITNQMLSSATHLLNYQLKGLAAS